jgi:hypothetical protein
LLNKASPAWMPERSLQGRIYGVFACNTGLKQPGGTLPSTR